MKNPNFNIGDSVVIVDNYYQHERQAGFINSLDDEKISFKYGLIIKTGKYKLTFLYRYDVREHCLSNTRIVLFEKK